MTSHPYRAATCECGSPALFSHGGRQWCRPCGRGLLAELAQHRQPRPAGGGSTRQERLKLLADLGNGTAAEVLEALDERRRHTNGGEQP